MMDNTKFVQMPDIENIVVTFPRRDVLIGRRDVFRALYFRDVSDVC